MSSYLLSLKEKLGYLASVPSRAGMRARLLLQGRLQCFELALSLVEGKSGLEIGGPSDVFRGWRTPSRMYGWRSPLPIYDRVASLDNCDFSSSTIWASHQEEYRFSPRIAPGKTIIADGFLPLVPDNTYDFVLSSHSLEHIANPVRALHEWKRVTRPGGSLILVLPDYRRTFDHRRPSTPVGHMFEDYLRNVGEDDTTHVSEVLQLHDVEIDGGLDPQTSGGLRIRTMNNLSNRCLHHHVFDEFNSAELLKRVGLEILAIELALPHHIVLLSRWK